MRQHKFAHGQIVCTDCDTFVGKVEVAALLPQHCECHKAPIYGCFAGDQHFSFCEELLAPLTAHQRRSMN